jgi:hypothetical protein
MKKWDKKRERQIKKVNKKTSIKKLKIIEKRRMKSKFKIKKFPRHSLKVNHKLLSMKVYLKVSNTQRKICNSAQKTFIQTIKMRRLLIMFLRTRNKILFKI